MIDKKLIEESIRNIIIALGDDPNRPGLIETPDRVARMYEEVFDGMNYTNDEIAEKFDKCFDSDSNDLVVVEKIPIFSYCEHHLALMYNMEVTVAYIPNGKVIGFSKVARIAEIVGKRLQLQERIGEDIAYIINDFLDKQESGELPVDLLFIWDSVGSIAGWKSYKSKAGNNMFDANSISTAFNSIVNTRIPSSRSQNYPYTNTFFIVNKIWDSSMATMGKPSTKLKGGVSFEYALRLLISCGKIVTSGVKKLEAVVKGEKYEYGTVAPIAVKKNHLPSPFNISREANLFCVGSGIITENEIDAYKKKMLPTLIKQLKDGDTNGKYDNITEDDIEFIEEDAE